MTMSKTPRTDAVWDNPNHRDGDLESALYALAQDLERELASCEYARAQNANTARVLREKLNARLPEVPAITCTEVTQPNGQPVPAPCATPPPGPRGLRTGAAAAGRRVPR